MHKSAKQILGLLICLGFFVWSVVYVLGHEDPQTILSEIRPVPLVVTAALHIVFLAVNGLYMMRVMRKLNVRIGKMEALYISFMTTGLNAFLPLTAGMVFRAFYLKKYHQLKYSEFIAVSAGTYLLNYYVVFLAGFFSACFVYAKFGSGQLALGLFGAAIIACSFVIFASSFIPHFKHSKLARLNVVLASWKKLVTDKSLIFDLSILSLVNLLIISVQVYVAYLAINTVVNFTATFFLTAIESLSLFIKVTPGNLGVAEALLAYAGSLIEVPVSRSLLASAGIRLTSYFVLLALMPIAAVGLFGSHWREALNDGVVWIRKNRR